MSKKAPLPPRFIPVNRKTTPPRDVVSHLCRNEAYKLMRADRKIGLAWSGLEGNAAFRFLKKLTHGEQMDYSALKTHQIDALQTIFMYVCYFEQDRSLALDITLPGMCAEWYAELFEDAVKRCTSTVRHLKRKQPGKKVDLDIALANAVGHWRITMHQPEVELRLAMQAAAETAEVDEAAMQLVATVS